MTDKTVANTILQQLGGNKFIVMTGAKGFITGGSDLGFRIGRNSSGFNFIRIVLNAMDTYDVEFIRIRKFEVAETKKVDGLYCDDLQRVFTETTGMDTHL